MTCKRNENGIKRRIDEGMTLEEIGKDMCEDARDPKKKVIRWMRNMPDYGDEWFLDDDNAEKYGYDNKELKRLFKEDDERKEKREEAQKIAEATDDEKEELTGLITELKDKIAVKGWDTTIRRCINDIEIPKTAVRFNKKYPKRTKTLSRCLDNIEFTKKILELHRDYPYTLKGTVNDIIKDIKVDSSDSADDSSEDDE